MAYENAIFLPGGYSRNNSTIIYYKKVPDFDTLTLIDTANYIYYNVFYTLVSDTFFVTPQKLPNDTFTQTVAKYYPDNNIAFITVDGVTGFYMKDSLKSREWISDYDSYLLSGVIPKLSHSPGIRLQPFDNPFYRGPEFLTAKHPNLLGTQYLNAHFTALKQKKTTVYDYQNCNIPDITIIQDTIGPKTNFLPNGIYPVDTMIINPVNDISALKYLSMNLTAKKLLDSLIAVSPLSDTVLKSVIIRRNFYTPWFFKKLFWAQPVISDSLSAFILSNSKIRPKQKNQLLRVILQKNRNQLSVNLISTILKNKPLISKSLLITTLRQYNTLPDSIYQLIIQHPYAKWYQGFLKQILNGKTNIPETIYFAILNNRRLRPFVIKNILTNNNPPSDTVLLVLLNRKPALPPGAVKYIFNRLPYMPSEQVLTALQQAKLSAFAKLAITNTLQKRPPWTKYCGNTQSSAPLALQSIEKYEYFDANYKGITTSEGFKKLLNIPDDSIQLRYEPSWQLYRTTQHSPQLRGAYTQKEYFYFYDLKNKYLRMPQYVPNSPNYLFIDSTMLDSSGVGPNGLTFGDIIFQNFNTIYYGNGLSAFQPEGLRLSYRNHLRALAYQQNIISKSVSQPYPVSRSSYYHYTADWTDEYSPGYQTIATGTGPDTCYTYYTNVFFAAGCYAEKYFPGKDFSFIPFGTIAYLTSDGLAYVCPINSLDTTGLNVTVLYTKPYPSDTNTVASNLRLPPGDLLRNVLWLKEVVTQIDTVPAEKYTRLTASDSLPFPSNGLMEFTHYLAPTTEYYEPVYPFDTLCSQRILTRNLNGLITLFENEKHLKTRIYYSDSVTFLWHRDNDCFANNYSSIMRKNIGLPAAMTVGYGRNDSLRTEYQYYPDGSIQRISLPDGQYSDYEYDMFGRLHKAFANNEKISEIYYHQWRNNHSLSFTQRTL